MISHKQTINYEPRLKPKPEDVNTKCLTLFFSVRGMYLQRSKIERERKNNSSCLKSSRALQHAVRLQYVDLHPITQPLSPPEARWATGLDVCQGQVLGLGPVGS